MAKENKQEKFWQQEFGKEYTLRNSYSPEELDAFYLKTWGISRKDLNIKFLGKLSRDSKILEIGCNTGQQLRHLQLLGFKNLYGIDLLAEAVEKAKTSTHNLNIIYGSAFDIPFRDKWFDLTFTSGVLIHVNPQDIIKALHEIHRCASTWIWGFEYYSPTIEEIIYRGHKDVLWKRDFCQLYLDTFSDLELVAEQKIKYTANDNVDQMFLLRKRS